MAMNPRARKRYGVRAKLAVVPPYAMRIDWDPQDRIFVVTVPELAGCMTHGRTYEEAAHNGREAIASWLGSAKRHNEPIPVPAVTQVAVSP